MYIHFIRSQALSALKKLQPALPRDNLIPQLSGIHLEADAERKEVTATARSTALAARISFPSEVEEAGSAVINGTLLCQLMEKFSGDDVDIQTFPTENAVLRSGRATFTLATLPPASYPQPVFQDPYAVSYTHLRAHETRHDLVCRLLLEKKKKKKQHAAFCLKKKKKQIACEH